jgi:hypothetical protein
MTICEFIIGGIRFITESLITGYVIIFIIKCIAYFKASKFCGTYMHESAESKKLSHVKFYVTIQRRFWYFLNPIQSITLNIERKGDQGDWSSSLGSDILNLTHFQGLYYITNKPGGGKDGWFDAYLFSQPYIRIALNLHFLGDDNRWKEDEGYYIIKAE